MTTTGIDTARRDALTERLFEATLGALELHSVHLGWRLGLYRVLADSGPLTSAELASRAGIDERYAREWLEQQAVAGFLDVAHVAEDGSKRQYALSAEHAEVLAEPECSAYVAPFAPMLVGIAAAMPSVVEAYRSGEGVPYPLYGTDFRDGQGAINRPAYVHELAGWLAAIPGLHERLASSDNPARVADLGCGQGWSTQALAAAYPHATVEGHDADEASVLDARGYVDDRDMTSRVSFAVGDASGLTARAYDLVCIFEALHDMAQPVAVLADVRRALQPSGCVLVADERVADSFTAPGDQVERMMYGWSVSHCLPASRAEQPSAALGTVLRASTVVELSAAAGFASCDVLPIDNDFFRFYLFRP